MGNASSFENISERYHGADPYFETWSYFYDPAYKIPVSENPPVDPFVRVRFAIRDFHRYFSERGERRNLVPSGYWDRHYQHVNALHEILKGISSVPEGDPEEWRFLTDIESRLRSFFQQNPVYGLLSPIVLRRVLETSRAIQKRCEAVRRDLDAFLTKAMSERGDHCDEAIQIAVHELEQFESKLAAEGEECTHCFELATQVRDWGKSFLERYHQLAVQASNRPILQDLHRLRLSKQQERLVASDYHGAYRIQGASGSGKTIILIHRAIRLASENPKLNVRLFTINRSLADLLRESIQAIHGHVPSNLHVAAFYDFLTDVLKAEFGSSEKHRLVDRVSGERIAKSWREFFEHRGRHGSQNVFARPEVDELVKLLRRRKRSIDACQYLRDEIVYIQSAYRKDHRAQYLSDPRSGRGLALLPEYRQTCLEVLTAWEDWLRAGHLCDVDGLTLHAEMLFETDQAGSPLQQLKRTRKRFPTEHLLLARFRISPHRSFVYSASWFQTQTVGIGSSLLVT